jgi:hypothetical protein
MKVETKKVTCFSLTDEEKNGLSSVIKLLEEMANRDDCLRYAVECEISENFRYLAITLERILDLNETEFDLC